MRRLIHSCVLAAVILCVAGAAFARPLPTAAPEIDPGMAAGALSVLIGGAMILLGRRQK
jgi:hypothetical protein